MKLFFSVSFRTNPMTPAKINPFLSGHGDIFKEKPFGLQTLKCLSFLFLKPKPEKFKQPLKKHEYTVFFLGGGHKNESKILFYHRILPI